MMIFDLILIVLSIGMILLGVYFLNHRSVEENVKQFVPLLGWALVLAGVIGMFVIISL